MSTAFNCIQSRNLSQREGVENLLWKVGESSIIKAWEVIPLPDSRLELKPTLCLRCRQWDLSAASVLEPCWCHSSLAEQGTAQIHKPIPSFPSKHPTPNDLQWRKKSKNKPAAIDNICKYHQEIQHSTALALISPTSRNLNIFSMYTISQRRKTPQTFRTWRFVLFYSSTRDSRLNPAIGERFFSQSCRLMSWTTNWCSETGSNISSVPFHKSYEFRI